MWRSLLRHATHMRWCHVRWWRASLREKGRVNMRSWASRSRSTHRWWTSSNHRHSYGNCSLWGSHGRRPLRSSRRRISLRRWLWNSTAGAHWWPAWRPFVRSWWWADLGRHTAPNTRMLHLRWALHLWWTTLELWRIRHWWSRPRGLRMTRWALWRRPHRRPHPRGRTIRPGTWRPVIPMLLLLWRWRHLLRWHLLHWWRLMLLLLRRVSTLAAPTVVTGRGTAHASASTAMLMMVVHDGRAAHVHAASTAAHRWTHRGIHSHAVIVHVWHPAASAHVHPALHTTTHPVLSDASCTHATTNTCAGTRLLLTGRHWPCFALALELIQRLLSGERNHRRLAVYFAFREAIHHHSHAALSAQTDYAKAFALTVLALLEEFHLVKIAHAHLTDGVRDVLVGGPPSEIPDI